MLTLEQSQCYHKHHTGEFYFILNQPKCYCDLAPQPNWGPFNFLTLSNHSASTTQFNLKTNQQLMVVTQLRATLLCCISANPPQANLLHFWWQLFTIILHSESSLLKPPSFNMKYTAYCMPRFPSYT